MVYLSGMTRSQLHTQAAQAGMAQTYSILNFNSEFLNRLKRLGAPGLETPAPKRRRLSLLATEANKQPSIPHTL